MTALTVPEVLRQAEQVIAERGWCQEDFTDRDGHVCALGAVNVVLTGQPWHEVVPDDIAALRKAIELVLSMEVGESVPDWNDADHRTADEVRAALLAAAQRAESTSDGAP